MSSFSQLKAKRDQRHHVHHAETARPVDPVQAAGVTASSSAPTTQGFAHSLPEGLEVRADEKRGRGLYATRSHKAGSSILTATPLQAVLSVPHLSVACSGCLLTTREIGIKTGHTPTLQPCNSCGILQYCSNSCRTLDLEDHEAECRILQAITDQAGRSSSMSNIPSEAIRALGRICLNRKKARSVKGKEPEWWSTVTSLENHLQQLSESGGLHQLAGLARQLGQYLAYSMPQEVSREELFASFGFNSTGELLELCSAFQVNSFTLSLPDVSPIGVAISPMIALANHSCDPNAAVVFPNGGRKMEVIAIRDIEPGAEVLTSYIDVSLPVEERRSELAATYRFTCECSLCLRDTEIRNPGYEGNEVDLRAAIWHQDCKRKIKGKGSLPVGWQNQGMIRIRCRKCKEGFDFDTTDLRVHCQRAVAFLGADAKGQDDLAPNSTLFQLIPALHAVLTPSSYPLLALLRIQLLRVRPGTSNELAQLDRLYSIVASSSALVYPANHPVLAILHAEWGQILTQTFDGEAQDLVSGRMIKSVELLRKAYDLCQKAFGKEGGIEGKKVAEVLRGLEAEIHLARNIR